MKRLILDIMVGILVLVALTLSPGHISWAGTLNSSQATYLSDDPNDPNEPAAESWSMDSQIVYLSEDANEPNEPAAE